LPHESNLRRGQAVGLVDEVAERALQFQSLGGEGAGGSQGAGVLAGSAFSNSLAPPPAFVSFMIRK
jgi:hypothetical protein